MDIVLLKSGSKKETLCTITATTPEAFINPGSWEAEASVSVAEQPLSEYTTPCTCGSNWEAEQRRNRKHLKDAVTQCSTKWGYPGARWGRVSTPRNFRNVKVKVKLEVFQSVKVGKTRNGFRSRWAAMRMSHMTTVVIYKPNYLWNALAKGCYGYHYVVSFHFSGWLAL